jgi:hypothetical protein
MLSWRCRRARRLLYRLTNHQLRQMAEAMDALNTAAEADAT